ncbi:hypothetical protein G6F68_019270 [Rhizopus microsporus]|nr:hypothetical protein G6F68_019270 [Rhizopus microsporus]
MIFRGSIAVDGNFQIDPPRGRTFPAGYRIRRLRTPAARASRAPAARYRAPPAAHNLVAPSGYARHTSRPGHGRRRWPPSAGRGRYRRSSRLDPARHPIPASARAASPGAAC